MRFHVVTGQGDRGTNEDCARAVVIDGAALFLLADGLGGHGKGGEAARAVVESFEGVFAEGAAAFVGSGEADAASIAGESGSVGASAQALLGRGFAESQQALLGRQRREGHPGDLKSTLVCLLICNGLACWGHIGDSRLYRFRGPRLEYRTRDHSVPEKLAASGEIREKEIRFHEDRARLLRAMGADWASCGGYDISPCEPVSPGDGFLLCSDGFWELVSEKEMSRLRKKHADAEGWLECMEAVVVGRGSRKGAVAGGAWTHLRRRQESSSDAMRRTPGTRVSPSKLDNYSAIAVTMA